MREFPHLLDRHLFLDVETTGLDAAFDEVIEIGAVLVEAGVAVSEHHWLVRPNRPVPPVISALTGLTDHDLDGAPSFDELEPALERLLRGVTVVAHNALFERSFLARQFRELEVLDSCELALVLFPELPSHSLDSLVRWAGRAPGTQHRALHDARDTVAVVQTMLERAAEPARRPALLRLADQLKGHGPMERVLRGLAEAAVETISARPETSPRPVVAPGLDAVPPVLDAFKLAPKTQAIELEVSEPDLLLQALAKEMGKTIWIAGPHARLKKLSIPRLPPRRAGSRAALQALVARRVVVDASLAAAMAYLSSWGERTDRDLRVLSGFWRDRVPLFDSLRTLLERRSDAAPPPGVFGGTPGEIAEWIESGVRPDAVIWLDAPASVDFERRRRTVGLEVTRLLRLPELFEVAAPGRPIGAALQAVHRASTALAGLLSAFQQSTLIDRGQTEPWLVLRDGLGALGHELAWWLSELRDAPNSALLEGVLGEASTVAELVPRLTTPSEQTELWASASGLWLRPTTASCEASMQALVATVPSLLVSDVRRAPTWERRLGLEGLERFGRATIERPLAVFDGLSTDEQLASVALGQRGPCTMLVGESSSEALITAFVRVAATQGRRVRLGPVGLEGDDVLLREWWGVGAPPQTVGTVVLVCPGDPLAVRRLAVRGLPLRTLLLREPMQPAKWQAALDGLEWELAERAFASIVAQAEAR